MARFELHVLSSGVIDLSDEIEISLNFSIADIREPEKRDGSFSKTIEIDGTKNNNEIFTHIYEVAKDGGFNPNKRASAVLYVDTIPVFEGDLQLIDVKIEDNAAVKYECVLFGRIVTIYNEWADDELTDIDFSDLNHTYSAQNIFDSWTAPLGSGYMYPLIDYGFSNGTNYKTKEVFPAIYLKEYIDRIFDYAGYTYTSQFLESDFFKRLIVPFSGTNLQLTADQLADRTLTVVRDTDNNFKPTSVGFWGASQRKKIEFESYTTTPNPSGQYDFGTSVWTVEKTGKYILSFDLLWEYIVTNKTGANKTASHYDNGIIIYIMLGSASIYGKSGGTLNMYVNDLNHIFNASSDTVIKDGRSQGSVEVYLQAGSQIRIDALFAPASQSYDLNDTDFEIGLNVLQESEFKVVPIAEINEGDTIIIESTVPEKTKIRDLFTSVCKAFNLYVDENKNKERDLIIEPRNDFYSSGVIVDWTEKLDMEQGIDIKPMGVLDAKRYTFKYKEDKDYWNSVYTNETGSSYGERTISSENEFLVETNTNELIFSPTPMVNIPFGSASDRIQPQIVQLKNNGVLSPMKGNIRLLYYAGLKQTNTPYDFISSSGTTNLNYYPFTGHTDDPFEPTLDICFGVPQRVFYKIDSYTNNNLYNKYHKAHIESITNKESKLVTAYFHLTPRDIYSLDFRNTIHVLGHNYKINKIEDYNPAMNGLTRVELIKDVIQADFVAINDSVNTGVNTFEGEGGLQQVSKQELNGNSTPQNGQVVVLGANNYIDPLTSGIIVIGEENNIAEGAQNISLISSSGNTIMPNVSNVTLINTSGVTVLQSNQVYINNTLQGIGASNKLHVEISSSYVVPSNVGWLLVDTSSGNVTIYLDNLQIGDEIVVTKKSLDANVIYLIGSSSMPPLVYVMNELSYGLTSTQLYSGIVKKFDDSNFYVINLL